ncbi:MAG: DUF1501 domain-containing protein [Saprospiraceae bacterium]|nr:DUF1501 domain-containing protein [Saprospiraceae bacterium]
MGHHHHTKKKLSRRQFLGEASCAAIGSTAFLSSILNLGAINAMAARPHIISNSNDYKAMVCILLAGGADSYNFLVPTQASEYNDYVATRSTLALAQGPTLLPLNYNNAGRTFAVHSGMDGIRDMFNAGEAAFISNIGTLIEPISSYAEFQAGMKKMPLGLYSHSDQIQQWQTVLPQSRSSIGYAGRIADVLHDMNTIDQVSLNISLAGKNAFQSGNQYNEYSISRSATSSNIGYEGFPSYFSNAGLLNDTRDLAIQNMAEQQYMNIFQQTIAGLNKQTQESVEQFRVALGNVIPINNVFSTTNLSADMKMIAELISVRQFLGANRQIFYVVYGGWDHHDDVINNQNAMVPILDNALTEFNTALKQIGMFDKVVTFTISDFARTLTSNGNGSDHAWGGNMMMMGGPVNGGQIYGNYPSLRLDSSNTLNLSSRGRILPQVSVDELYAELALWFGVSPNDLAYVIPNICNFYDPSSCPTNPGGSYTPLGIIS